MDEEIIGIEVVVPGKDSIQYFKALGSDTVLTILKKLPKLIDRSRITLPASYAGSCSLS